MTYPDALQVTTSHLRGLATTHARVAREIGAAADLVTDVDRTIALSHGVIAASTMAVVAELQQARQRCTNAASDGARALSDDLSATALRYEDTDGSAGGELNRQVRPR